MCLAKNIRYLRKKADMSQDKLADILNYKSYTTIQKWESGVAEPSIKVVRQIADLFHVDITDIATVDLEARDMQKDVHPVYYTNPETAAIAQEIFDDHDLRALFDAGRGASPEDLKMAVDLLRRLKATNPDG